MVTFTPDGRYVLVAIEGEPSDDYAIDPEGAVGVIDVGRGRGTAVALSADFTRFNADREAFETDATRSGPNAEQRANATLAADVEPEYIAVAPDGRTAWVTLQENNAIANVDVPTARVKASRRPRSGRIIPSRAGDSTRTIATGVRIRCRPVMGMYQPDGIAAFHRERRDVSGDGE